MSGGNQQKLVLAKWLSLTPKLIIFDEPTRGVDVGSKAEIYRLMRSLAESGVFILMISSDMEEVLGVSDRIAVMREGALMGVLEAKEFSEEAVMRLAVAPVHAKEDPPMSSHANSSGDPLVRQKKELGMVAIFLALFVGYALLEGSQRGLAATLCKSGFSWSGKPFEPDKIDRIVWHLQRRDGHGDHYRWNRSFGRLNVRFAWRHSRLPARTG